MFDKERTGTGTKEWAEHSFNIQVGCSHGCLYCYAAHNAHRFKVRNKKDWKREELTKNADITTYPLRKGVVMFPTSHDITPSNVKAYIKAAKVILEKANKLLIVSKPNISCIAAIMGNLAKYQEQILFRFTIGSVSKSVCELWEPGAPPPSERIAALTMACDFGWQTSVSIEPMLSSARGAMDVVESVQDYVTDTIWIGKMNNVDQRVDTTNAQIALAAEAMRTLQSDDEIIYLYNQLKDHPKVRWKDSIKEVLSKVARTA